MSKSFYSMKNVHFIDVENVSGNFWLLKNKYPFLK